LNGKVWPFLEVEPRKYRFRILNASNARFYHLTLKEPDRNNVATDRPGPVFKQIGSDGADRPGGVFENPAGEAGRPCRRMVDDTTPQPSRLTTPSFGSNHGP
jgi:hypothetical protein